ncbi:MAG TPA: hypothetical protein VMY35_06895 [Phycisphaerae bacterium]|nr:hypothetical protein [Phycisphaerae bacterium]
MKAAKLTILLLLILALMVWVRSSGQDLGHLAKILPFCSGNPPSLYDFGALILIVMCFFALRHLKQAQEAEHAAQDSRHDSEDNQQPQP